MWNVAEKVREHGWARVARDFYREVKAAHLMLLQELREAPASSPQAPVTRRGAKKLSVVQARLVKAADDLGAVDSSRSVARITTADDLDTAAFRDDLQRKVSLRKVMHPDEESENIIDDLLGNDDDKDEPECHDDLGFVVPCDSPDAVDRLSEDDDARRPAGQLGMRPQGQRGEELPEPGSGQVSKEDVNYKYAADESKQCQKCKNFRAPSGCSLVAGLIRPVDTCDMFNPIRKPTPPSFYGR